MQKYVYKNVSVFLFIHCSRLLYSLYQSDIMADSIYYPLSRYTQPILIVLGTIGAINNQILFLSRRSLRVSSCSLYFRVLSINDLFVLYFFVLQQWLIDQYGLDADKKYEWYCKFRAFVNTVLYTISPYLVVLACFDRLCTSSTSARLRRIATIRIASILIPCVVILTSIIYFHIPIWYRLIHYPTVSSCTITDQVYIRFNAILISIYLAFLPPVLMIIFCCITIVFLRQQHRRVMPTNQARLRQRDNQLLKMLLSYVISHVLCTIPFSTTLLILVYQISNTSTLIVVLLFRLSVLLFNVNFATSFYIYTLGTPFYRHELCCLVREIYQRVHRKFHQNQTHI